MKYRLSLVLLVALAACGKAKKNKTETTSPAPAQGMQELAAKDVQTTVCGTAFGYAPQISARARLYAVDAEGLRGKQVADTVTDGEGHYCLDAATYEGRASVEVDTGSEQAPLTAWVPAVVLGEQQDVMVTPVTSLTASYAKYVLRQANFGPEEDPWAEALMRAQLALNNHFFRLQHQSVTPKAWPHDKQEGFTLDQGALASLVGQTLRAQAARVSAEHAEGPAVTWTKLLAALRRDVEADGRFDGFVSEVTPATVDNRFPLSAEALRHDFVEDAAAFLGSSDNHTPVKAEDVTGWLHEVEVNEGRLFLPRRTDSTPPQLASCSVTDSEGKQRSLSQRHRGRIELLCRWQDDVEMSFSKVGTYAGQDFAQTIREGKDEVLVALDLDALHAYAPQRSSVVIPLVAQDTSGNAAHHSVEVAIATAPPTVTVTAYGEEGKPAAAEAPYAWVAPGAAAVVEGYVNAETRTLTLAYNTTTQEVPLGAPDQDHRRPFRAKAINLACDAAHALVLTATDDDDQVAEKTLEVRCVSAQPTVAPRVTAHAQDHDQGETPRDDGWSNQGALYRKLVQRLNYAPVRGQTVEAQNLPRVAFDVVQTDYAASLGPVQVSYRYLHRNDHTLVRDWTPLAAVVDNHFELPISYQTLLAEEVVTAADVEDARAANTVALSKVHEPHVIEFRLRDAAGQQVDKTFTFFLELRSPSPKITNLRPTAHLWGMRWRSLGLDNKNNPYFVATVEWDLACGRHDLHPCPSGVASARLALDLEASRTAVEEDAENCEAFPNFVKVETCGSAQPPHGVWFAEGGCLARTRQTFTRAQPTPTPVAKESAIWRRYRESPASVEVKGSGPSSALTFVRGPDEWDGKWTWREAKGDYPATWLIQYHHGYEWHDRVTRHARRSLIASEICAEVKNFADARFVPSMAGYPAPLPLILGDTHAKHCWSMYDNQ